MDLSRLGAFGPNVCEKPVATCENLVPELPYRLVDGPFPTWRLLVKCLRKYTGGQLVQKDLVPPPTVSARRGLR